MCKYVCIYSVKDDVGVLLTHTTRKEYTYTTRKEYSSLSEPPYLRMIIIQAHPA